MDDVCEVEDFDWRVSMVYLWREKAVAAPRLANALFLTWRFREGHIVRTKSSYPFPAM